MDISLLILKIRTYISLIEATKNTLKACFCHIKNELADPFWPEGEKLFRLEDIGSAWQTTKINKEICSNSYKVRKTWRILDMWCENKKARN